MFYIFIGKQRETRMVSIVMNLLGLSLLCVYLDKAKEEELD